MKSDHIFRFHRIFRNGNEGKNMCGLQRIIPNRGGATESPPGENGNTKVERKAFPERDDNFFSFYQIMFIFTEDPFGEPRFEVQHRYSRGECNTPYLIFVIFFTQAKIWGRKFYTKERVNYGKRISRQNSINCDILAQV